MKIIIFILVIISTNVFGQSDVIINGKSLNRIDKNGQKQGIWELYSDGELLMKCNYINDTVIDAIKYYKNKKIVFELEPNKMGKRYWHYFYNLDTVNGYSKYNEDNIFENYYLDNKKLDSSMNWKLISVNEIYPEYYGGRQKMLDYLKNSFSSLKDTGQVKVAFTINQNGEVVDIQIIESTNSKLNEYVLKTFQNMPRWQPGHQRGKMVRVRMKMPLKI